MSIPPILIYKNVLDFIFEFDIFIELNGNETTTYKGNNSNLEWL